MREDYYQGGPKPFLFLMAELSLGAINPVVKEEKDHHDLLDILLSTTDPSIEINLPDILPVLDTNVATEPTRLPKEDAVVLSGLFSPDEAQKLFRYTQKLGYSFWDASNPNPRRDYRNADTVELTDESLAGEIWRRVAPFVQESYSIERSDDDPRYEPGLEGEWRAYGINPKLLFGWYPEGGHFSPHTDGATVLDFNHRSLCSVIVYMNDCAEGGGTKILDMEQMKNMKRDDGGRFISQEEYVKEHVHCATGRCLIFYHTQLHEGVPVGKGCEKIIIRTDVMYERVPRMCDSPQDKKAFLMFEEARELEAQGKVQEAAQTLRLCFKLSPALADVYGM
eukprot:TRINITY_DN2314_c0_g1_i1.p1 TRINITY_DN2314_c0_g1~~TRINITY_DN2314_c0_g1_i1.p1  ORF type:complete len:337 (-),score=79.31 TRINITY_DN2314_c0_g1_i1:63-1073(-)